MMAFQLLKWVIAPTVYTYILKQGVLLHIEDHYNLMGDIIPHEVSFIWVPQRLNLVLTMGVSSPWYTVWGQWVV